MSKDNSTFKEYFNELTILYIALLVGQVIFCGVAYYLVNTGTFEGEFKEFVPILQIIVPAFVLLMIFISSFAFKSRLQTIREQTTLKAKLMDYRAYLIIKLALLDGAALFALVSYLLTAEILFVALAGLPLLAFLIHRPSKERIIQDLLLSPKEKAILDDANAVMS